MKRSSILIAFILLCISGMALAQETIDTTYRMTVGDTVVWQPFEQCADLSYNVSGSKRIDFKYLKHGLQLQIIAKQAGNSSVTATCTENNAQSVAYLNIAEPYVAPTIVKLEKPKTQTFTGSYVFAPPATDFFITINDEGSRFNETYMKHGDIEAFNDGQGLDRYWNIKNGENWYYRPEAQGWTDDVKWEFEPFGESFAPLNAFANEVDKSNLSNYYVGMEKLTVGGSKTPFDIDCWHFFVDFEDGTIIQYWVDPANGCTLKRQVNTDAPKVVTVYDLHYTKIYFGPTFKKHLMDTSR